MLKSGAFIFDAILNKDGSKIEKFNISKNTLGFEIEKEKIESIILKGARENDILQERIFFENAKGLTLTAVFKKDKESIFVYGFIVPETRFISSGMFEIFNDIDNACIILYQNNGEIIFANKNFYNVLGYSENDLKGRHICEFIGKPHKDICYHNVSQRLKSVKFSSAYDDVKIISADGKEKVFNVYGNTVIYNSKPAGILFCVDITQESSFKKLYRAIKDINQIIIRVEDEDELFSSVCNVLISVGFAAAIVVSIDENKRVNVDYIAGEGREFFERVFATVNGVSAHGKGMAAKAFSQGTIAINPDTQANPDMVYWRDDLLKFGFHSNCAIPIVVDGEVENILLVFSHRKNAFVNEYLDLLNELKGDVEFALKKIRIQRNLKLTSKILDEIEECVIITDDRCRVEYVNNAFEKALGYTPDEIKGKTPLFFGYKGREINCKEDEVHARLSEGKQVEFEYKVLTKNKEYKIYKVSIIPIHKGGKLSKSVSLMRDITLQKKQQEQLELLNRFYLTIYHLNESLISAKNEDKLLRDASEVMVKHLNATLSFVALKVNDGWTVEHLHIRDKQLENLAKELKAGIERFGGKTKELPFGRAYLTNRVKVSVDIDRDSRTINVRDLARRYNLKSCFAVPLSLSSKVIGVAVAVFDSKVEFGKRLYNLLLQVKSDLDEFLQHFQQRRWNKIIFIALDAGFSYVIIMDRFFRIVYMNEAALQLHGYRYDEIIGKKHSIFSSKQHDKDFIERVVKTLRSGKAFSDLFIYRVKDGRLIEGYTTIIPYKENGQIKHYIAVGKDITKEKELQKKLIFLSKHDLLTKLPNKDEFLRKVKSILRKKSDKISVFVIVDINGCSYVNQIYGYVAGDELIRETAKRLTIETKNNDAVCRLTADKFGLFMYAVESEEDALVRLMDILKKLNRSVKVDGHSVVPSYHIGVSFYPVDGEDPDDLLSKAELALISSKSQGENEIGFFKKNTQQKVFKVIQLKDKLKEAFENKEFVLFYQPYYSIETKEIAGAEALLRWIHEGKVIPPSEFIEVLEDSNLMFDVEERIIYKAVRTIASLGKKVPISINISPKSFKRDYLTQIIKQTLRDFDIEGKYLTVEIIERVFVDDIDYTKKVLYELKDMGVRIAVDDFGTGYSSLTYIRELPIDILKIDIAFIRNMLKNKKDLSLVKLIVNMSKEFGLKTTAEGVETKEQFEILKGMGCDYAQGYLFCKPIDKDSFTKILK